MKKIISLFLSLVMLTSACLCLGTVAFADDYTIVNIDPTGSDPADAIQQAINLCKRNNISHCKFVVKPGTYTLKSRIAIFTDTWLELTGVTFNRAFSGSVMLTVGRNDDGSKGYDFYNNIIVNGGTFNSNPNGKASNTGSIFVFSHASNVTISNVTFLNCCSGHHLTFAGCKNVNVTGCNFEGQYYASGDNDENMEAVQLDILEETHFPGLQKKSYDGTMNRDITITGCTFNDLNRGVGSHSVFSGMYMENIAVTDNVFSNIGGYAVQTSNYINVAITGNTITNCGSGIYYRSIIPKLANTFAGGDGPVMETSAVIANNEISVVNTNDKTFSQLGYGVRVYGENLTTGTDKINAGDYRAYNVTVTGNKIDINTNANGLWLVGAVAPVVTDNIVNYTAGSLRSSEKCFGVRYEKSKDVNLTNNVIAANSVSCVQNGIISDKSTGVLTGNSVSNAVKNGINISTKSTATLASNTVSGNGENGIFCYDNSSINTSSNTISGNKKHGIFIVSCPKVSKLKGDSVSSNKQYGVAVQQSKAKLSSLKVKKNNNYGIYLTQSASASMNNCTSISNKKEGIYITQKSNANITGGSVESNKGCGIYFTNKAKGSVKNVAVKKNKGTGIYLTKKVGKITISGVKYSGNKGGKLKK